MKILLSLCALFLIDYAVASKLNYPRVLLPIFDHISTNFTLEVYERGCFTWVSSRQDLIQITPVYEHDEDDCAYRAIVTAISKEKRRSTAIVLAEDRSSGHVLRCDVILDVIDQLGVLTTTRELYLEEAPETFELWAQDSQGNAFTTLEGIEFNWQISSQTQKGSDDDNNSWQKVLRFLSFSKSTYHEIPKSVEKIEAAGIKGYMVLLEGINTGTATVTVRLPHTEYNAVPPVVVNIMVLANIILDPVDVHILVDDTVSFRVLQLKQGKLQEIALNHQYYIEIEDEAIATMAGAQATGRKLGRTTVVLRDRNVPSGWEKSSDDDSSKTFSPRATLTVSRADKISLNLLPYYNWVTVAGERHEIAIDLHTHDDQKITLGPKYELTSDFDDGMFYALSKNKNGSRIYGEAVQNGITPVTASFQNLKTKAELQIYKGIDLIPSRVILPFDPNNPKHQSVQFKATGGDGSFVWTSMNSNVVSISQTGLADTKLEQLKSAVAFESSGGSTKSLTKIAQIRVAMNRNAKISKTADIYFLAPVKLQIIKYNFETALKDYVKVHVAVYAEINDNLVPFTSCDNLHFDLMFSNQIFQTENAPESPEAPSEGACRVIHLKATNLGQTNFKVSYTFLDSVLKDEVNLVVFEKLKIMNPIANEIVLPIGAMRNVIYFNGPQKVFNIEAELVKNVIFDKKIATIVETRSDNTQGKYVYNVLCRKVGETALKLNIYNSLSTDNYVSYVSEFVTKIYCVKPRFINLYTTEKLRTSCPMKTKSSLMHVRNTDENLEIGIEILDAYNRKLMNISSLTLQWQFLQGDENIAKTISYTQQTDEDHIEGVAIPRHDFLHTTIKDIQQSFKIIGSVADYKMPVLRSFNIIPEEPHFSIQKSAMGASVQPVIENELNFVAVNSALLPYDSISIYLGKSQPERTAIAQGSGFYEINLSEVGIVSVEFDEPSRELVITPLRIGQVKLSLLDRCLMTEASHLYVSVVSIGKIELQVPDRVERTKSIEAIVKLYDSNDELLVLDHSNSQVYELREHIFNTNILGVQLGEQFNLNVGEIRYIVYGLELGETKLQFSSGGGERQISSAPAAIQVFPPLQLYPRNVTLIVGGSVQIYAHGGPHPDVNIVYSVQHENVISMDSAVALALKLGQTRITGRCVGVNPANGRNIIFSEDSVDIHVVPFHKIRIKTPLVRIKTDAVMPASIWGEANMSPMILGSLDNIKIVWSTNQPDVVDIVGRFSDAGVEYKDADMISVLVKARNPGKAKIQADVIIPNGLKLTTTVEITVFNMLELQSPKHITSSTILISTKSNIQLKANLDDAVYQLGDGASGVVKVTRDGLVKSSETIGRDLIIASSGDQTLSVPVEVKNVHYILAHLQTSIKLKNVEHKIPRGLNLVLKVTLHDNLGNMFSHNFDDMNALRYKLSRKDMVNVQVGNNFTLQVHLPRETSSMLLVSLKDTNGIKYAEDYIKLSVGQSSVLFPTTTIFSVGDIICFDSPLAALSTNWISSDESIINVDKNLGVGKIVATKSRFTNKVTVFSGDDTNGYVNYDLEIRDADHIEFPKSYDIFNGEHYKALVVIKNHLQIDKFSNIIAKNVSRCRNLVHKVPSNFFSCKLKLIEGDRRLLESFKVMPTFDNNGGAYACEVTLLTSLNELIHSIKINEFNFEIEAALPNGISNTMTLKMVPAIKVTPTSIPLERISSQTITVTGLDKVLQGINVKPSDESVFSVHQIGKLAGSLQYKIKLINNVPEGKALFVKVTSPLTGQTIDIPIDAINTIQMCASQAFNGPNVFNSIVSNFGTIIIYLIVLGATVWAFVFCGTQYRNYKGTGSSPFNNAKSVKSQSTLKVPASPFLQKPQQLSSQQRSPALYPSLYAGNTSGTSNLSSSPGAVVGGSPVYGDPTLISPQKRINRRYL